MFSKWRKCNSNARLHQATGLNSISIPEPRRNATSTEDCAFCAKEREHLQINEFIDINTIGNTNSQIHAGVAQLEHFQSIFVRLNQLEQLVNNHAARNDANVANMRSLISQKVRVLNNNIRVFGGTVEGGFRVQQANTGRVLQQINNPIGC